MLRRVRNCRCYYYYYKETAIAVWQIRAYKLCVWVQSSHVLGIKCSTLHVDGKPAMVTMDYRMDVASLAQAYGKDLNVEERLSSSSSSYHISYIRLIQLTYAASTKKKIKSDYNDI